MRILSKTPNGMKTEACIPPTYRYIEREGEIQRQKSRDADLSKSDLSSCYNLSTNPFSVTNPEI